MNADPARVRRARAYLGLDEAATWRAPEIEQAALIPHELRAAAHLIAPTGVLENYEVTAWNGPGGVRLDPPVEGRRGRTPARRTTLADVNARLRGGVGGALEVRDLGLEEFRAVKSDYVLDLRRRWAPGAEAKPRRVQIRAEVDRTGRSSKNEEKFLVHDAFLTAWARELNYFTVMGEPPLVLFVCQSAAKAEEFARAADPLVTGAVASDGPAPGRVELRGPAPDVLRGRARRPHGHATGAQDADLPARAAARAEGPGRRAVALAPLARDDLSPGRPTRGREASARRGEVGRGLLAGPALATPERTSPIHMGRSPTCLKARP